MTPWLAGLVAGIPVGVVAGLLLWLRAGSWVPPFKAASAEMAGWSDGRVTLAMAGGSALFSPVFGIVAGLVYAMLVARWPGMASTYFLALAAGMAVVASVLAAVTRTVMALEKIVLNLVFGLGLGMLIPWLAR